MASSCGVKDCKVVKVHSISVSGSSPQLCHPFSFVSFTDQIFKTKNTNTHTLLSFKDVVSAAGVTSFETNVSEGHD